MTALTLATAFLLAVIGTARATRLITHDAWPPVAALRRRWLTWTAQTERREPWGDLMRCPFCVAPWLTILTLAAAVAAGVWPLPLDTLTGWWWLLATWASVAYLAAMVVVRDEPPADDA